MLPGKLTFAETDSGKTGTSVEIGNHITPISVEKPEEPLESSVSSASLVASAVTADLVNVDNALGELLWTFKKDSGGVIGRSVGADGTLFVSTSDQLYALTPDGNQKWEFVVDEHSNTDDNIVTSVVTAANGANYFATAKNKIYAVSAHSTLLWIYDVGEEVINNSLVTDKYNHLYFTTENDTLYKLDAQGKLQWQRNHSSATQLHPVFDDEGTMYLGDENHNLNAILPDGRVKWSVQLGTTAVMPTVTAQGTVYVGTRRSRLYAISPEGKIQWQYKFFYGNSVRTAPFVGPDNRVYITHEGDLYTFDLKGSLLWKAETESFDTSSPVMDHKGNLYYIGTDNQYSNHYKRYLYAVGNDGALLWSRHLDYVNNTTIKPMISSGQLIISRGSLESYNLLSDEVNPTVVDFESGDLSQADFSLQGQKSWVVGTDSAIEGFSVSSPDGMEHGQHSTLTLTGKTGSGFFQFDYKVESEANFDSLVFFIDGKRHKQISGFEQGQVRFYLKPGEHRFQWRYIKDSRLSAGQDQVQIDNISMPKWVDSDGDGITDAQDNCPNIANPAQLNNDGDFNGGDACDTDDDNDGVEDQHDQMPFDGNESIDSDGDGIGDNRDTDDDNDGVTDSEDIFPLDASESYDSDGDGIGNNADDDDDNDGMSDNWELANGLNPEDPVDAFIDADGDGYSNIWELYAGSDPNDNSSVPDADVTNDWRIQTNEGRLSDLAIGQDGVIYVGAQSGFLYAINPDGTQRWRFDDSLRIGSITENPVVSNRGDIYTYTDINIIYHFNVKGQLVWYWNTEAEVLHKPLVTPDNHLIIAIDNNLCQLPADGSLVDCVEMGSTITAAPVVDAQGTIYFGTSEGRLHAWHQGREQWQLTLGQQALNLVITDDNGKLVIAADDGKLSTVNTEGDLLWQFDSGTDVTYQPIIGIDQKIYLRDGEHRLVALASDGSLLWRYAVPADLQQKPRGLLQDNNGVIYLADAAQTLHAVNADGTKRWRYPFEADITSAPLMDENSRIYIGLSNGAVHALKVDEARPAPSPWPMAGQNGARTSLKPTDSDGDGLPDGWEIQFGLNENRNDANQDADNDGYSNALEFKHFSDPNNPHNTPGVQGMLKWRVTTSGKVYSSPAQGDDGTLYVGNEIGFFSAISPQGELKWRYRVGARITSSPAIDINGSIYFGSANGHLYALNRQGELLWAFDTKGSIIASPSVAPDGTIYIGNSDGVVRALSDNGEQLWQTSLEASTHFSPAIGQNGHIYVSTSDGKLRALDQENGEIQWTIQTDGDIRSAISLDHNGNIYVGSYDGYIYSINPEGSVNWRFATNDNNRVGSGIAIDNSGRLYFADAKGVIYSIDSSGEPLWQYQASGWFEATPTIDDKGLIYFANGDRNVLAFDARGNLKWTHRLWGYIWSSPVLDDGVIYVGSSDGHFYALHTNSGGMDHSAPWPMFANNRRHTGYILETNADNDGDGVPDSQDNCPSISNPDQLNSDGKDDGGDACDSDDDDDLMPDIWEVENGLDPLDPTDTDEDIDNDGVANYLEYLAGTAANSSNERPQVGSKALEVKVTSSTSYTTSTPVVAEDGTVYVTTNAGLTAYDRYLKFKWHYDVAAEVSASPVIGIDGTIYFGDRSGMMHAIDPYGQLKWNYQAGEQIFGSAAINAYGTLYYTVTNGQLLAQDPNGKLLWTYAISPGWNSVPVIDSEGVIYLSDEINLFHAVNPDGTRRWQALLDSGSSSQAAIAYDGMIYIGKEAFDRNGQRRWTNSASLIAGVLDNQGNYYAQSYQGELFALDKQGQTLWQTSLESNNRTGISGSWRVPLLGEGGEIYFVTPNGYLYAIDRQGQVSWSLRVYGGNFNAPVMGKNGLLYLYTSHGSLIAVYADSQKPLDSPWPMVGANFNHTGMTEAFDPSIDSDEDSIADAFDNCPLVANPNQTNTDQSHDGGDACDNDDDNDGIEDSEDQYPQDPTEVRDSDGDGIADNRDDDIDNDGVANHLDAMPFDASEYSDHDGDGIGDNADTDDDNDGMDDQWELRYGLNPLSADDQDGDPDGDGYSNIEEFLAGTSPLIASQVVQAENLTKWTVDLNAAIESSPAIAQDGTVYVVNQSGILYAVSGDGEVLWHYGSDIATSASPTLGNSGAIFVGNGKTLQSVQTDGQMAWSLPLGGKVNGGPAQAIDGSLYVASSDGMLTAVSQGGEKLWEVADVNGGMSRPAIDGNGVIYIGSSDGLLAINPDGTEKWRFETGSYVRTNPAISASGNVVFASSDGLYYAVKPTGEQAWSYDTSGHRVGNPVITGKGISYFVADYHLHALDGNGEEIWKVRVGNSRSTPAIGANGVIYVGSDSDGLKAFNTDGSERFDHRTLYADYNSGIAITNDGLIIAGDEYGNLHAVSSNSYGYPLEGWPRLGANNSQTGNVDGGQLDRDNDGVIDGQDNCPFIPNEEQINTDGEPDGGDACDLDDDNDQMPDTWELEHGLNPLDAADAGLDADDDGFSNLREFLEGFDPNDPNSRPDGYGEVKWQIDIGANRYSSPALANDGTLYVGSESDHLYAIDSKKGVIKWQHDIGEDLKSSPAIAPNGNILFSVDNQKVVAINQEGEAVWSTKINDKSVFGGSNDVSVSADGTIYMGVYSGTNGNQMFSLSSSGEVNWQFDSGKAIWSRPSIDKNGNIYFGNRDKFIALNPSGELLWQYESQWGFTGTSAIAEDGTIYITEGNLGLTTAWFTALTPQGELKWRIKIDYIGRTTPLIAADGTIYFVTESGYLYAVDPIGFILWKFNAMGKSVTGVPIIGLNGLVYISSADGIYELDTAGRVNWHLPLEGATHASPVLDKDGILYVSSGEQLVAIYTVSKGVQDAPWPMRGQNPSRNGQQPVAGEDSDGDGIVDRFDNCPDVANFDQLNTDGVDDGGDACDDDDDNDGVLDLDDVFPLDATEWSDNDMDGVGDNADSDDDNDGMSDTWESFYGLNPLDSADANIDSDGDGYSNLQEYKAGSDPTNAQSTPENVQQLNPSQIIIWMQLLEQDKDSKQRQHKGRGLAPKL